MSWSSPTAEKFPLHQATKPEAFDPFSPAFSPENYSEGKSHFQITFYFVWEQKRRQALADLYAFCRIADDISDQKDLDKETRQNLIESIRHWVKTGEPKSHPFWSRFLKARKEFQIPDRALMGILDGVSQDIDRERVEFQTWVELDLYIYGVACCVGECVLAILGANSPEAKNYADAMGKCLQYLNIMRDIEEDETNGRIYIPREFLKTLTKDRFPPIHCLPDIRRELFSRAMTFRQNAQPYSKKCLPAELMAALYIRASQKYWRHGNPKRLSGFQKFWISLKTALKFYLGAQPPRRHQV
ncbi:MAG: squalene/phytoene synthase family protein [Deltaproteobacteria bacterium]|nr:squalene/phytoene synthase family protein [Deltaproteobacteria bacterium]